MLTPRCSMKDRHRSNPKGWLCHCAICGVIYTGGNRRQNPSAVLRHQWGWAVPGQSLASAGFTGKSTVSPVSWAWAFSSGPPARCVLCRDKSMCNLQAVVSVLETSVHEWFICVSETSLNDPKTGKAASQMLLLWFGCVSRGYFVFVA